MRSDRCDRRSTQEWRASVALRGSFDLKTGGKKIIIGLALVQIRIAYKKESITC